MAPSLEERSALAILEHPWGAHDNHGIFFLRVDAGVFFEVMNVSVFERICLNMIIVTSSL